MLVVFKIQVIILIKNGFPLIQRLRKTFYIKNNKIKGNDENGCNYYGSADKLNNKIYSINLEIASCGISDGVYIGMAYIEVEDSKEKLKINATNKNFSLLMKFK